MALRSDGLGHGADLVDFQQQTVAGFHIHSLANTIWVGHSQIIANHLDVCASCEVCPGRPVILVEGILYGNHWEEEKG